MEPPAYNFSISGVNADGCESCIHLELQVMDDCNFEFPHSAIATVLGRRFRLRSHGNFVQWGYLVDPPSYGAHIDDGTQFLEHAAASLRGRTLHLALDVNSVVQQATRYGRKRRTYLLQFVEV